MLWIDYEEWNLINEISLLWEGRWQKEWGMLTDFSLDGEPSSSKATKNEEMIGRKKKVQN